MKDYNRECYKMLKDYDPTGKAEVTVSVLVLEQLINRSRPIDQIPEILKRVLDNQPQKLSTQP